MRQLILFKIPPGWSHLERDAARKGIIRPASYACGRVGDVKIERKRISYGRWSPRITWERVCDETTALRRQTLKALACPSARQSSFVTRRAGSRRTFRMCCFKSRMRDTMPVAIDAYARASLTMNCSIRFAPCRSLLRCDDTNTSMESLLVCVTRTSDHSLSLKLPLSCSIDGHSGFFGQQSAELRLLCVA